MQIALPNQSKHGSQTSRDRFEKRLRTTFLNHLIQGRYNMTRVEVEPRSYDQGHHKNDTFTHLAMLLKQTLNLSLTLILTLTLKKANEKCADKYFFFFIC